MKLLTYAINKKELTGVLNREGTFVSPFCGGNGIPRS